MNPPRAGYTLPVFACAAAIAALRHLHQGDTTAPVPVDLIEPATTVDIEIEQVARLSSNMALAITRSDPGDNLDLTRHTPIWGLVTVTPLNDFHDGTSRISFSGGEGIGRIQQGETETSAIYAYARRLMEENLSRWLAPHERVEVVIILPEGRNLAQRTSNAAFGVVDGLSLLGSSGISQPLSAPGQLQEYRGELQRKAPDYPALVFCIGENGLDLAQRLGINPARLIKTANWLGPLLVEAGCQGVKKILLFGYHGKLIKLAGGIFHTHHYLADGRREIITAHAARLGLSTADVQHLFVSATTEDALDYLRQLDRTTGHDWVNQVYGAIAEQIDERCQSYIHAQGGQEVEVGSLLFDRHRKIVIQSAIGATLLPQVLLS